MAKINQKPQAGEFDEAAPTGQPLMPGAEWGRAESEPGDTSKAP